MKMNPEEITSIIKERIKNYDVDLNVNDVGTVLEVGDGIAHIYGLDKAMAGELLDFGNDVYGLVLNLEQESVGAVLLGGDTVIKEGDTVKRTGRIMQVPVGEAMIGRVVDALAPAQLKELTEKLERITGKQVSLREHRDPSLIGGVVVRIGDRRIDGSIKGRLAAMTAELMAN